MRVGFINREPNPECAHGLVCVAGAEREFPLIDPVGV
jgi:hypothetical protein